MGVLVPYYPVLAVSITVDAYILIRIYMIIAAYEFLVKNESIWKD
ncbi:hypothetical protein P4H28_01010 [Paenibacillus larvae]|nr:hypothetical protein [Paenibacillus larvae]MEC0185086.1 hypothetical protein [Paenibacillus larvae]